MSSKSTFRNSGYTRVERDFYPTPPVYVDILFQHWTPTYLYIHEPCAGELDMVRAIESHDENFIVTHGDIKDGQDFLYEYSHHPVIITNSPYGTLGPKIVRHALTRSRQCAFLFPFDWDAAGSRADLFTVDSPFRMKLAINKRYKWIEDSKSSGMHNFAWYIWDQNWIGKEPVMRYGPN